MWRKKNETLSCLAVWSGRRRKRQQEIEAFPRNMREVGIPEWRSRTEEGTAPERVSECFTHHAVGLYAVSEASDG